MEIQVSINVQDIKVSLTLRLKNSLNIQNPASLRCEQNILPLPIASTINSGATGYCAMAGAIKPAAVSAATVALPIDTRITAANK